MLNANQTTTVTNHPASIGIDAPVSIPVSIKDRQAPLRRIYTKTPSKAWIIDTARTSSAAVPATQPLYGSVEFETSEPVTLPIGVHKAVGGKGDFPSPGEVLTAAIASCLDSAIRMIANIQGIPLTHLEVKANAMVDVRGTLRMGQNIPVGFQEIDIEVQMTGAAGVSEAHLDMLLAAGEQSCILLQTLKNPPSVTLERKHA